MAYLDAVFNRTQNHKEMLFMGIFEDLNNNGDDFVKPIDLGQIFSNLNQVQGYDYPRSVQSDFFKEWYSRRSDKDLIGILGTGTGKTLLGLLVLQSYLNDNSGPCLYLCPTKQLVRQTIIDAGNFGVQTVEFSSSEFPSEFINSEAILVTTFDKVFNGRSKFGFDTPAYQKIGGLVVDDAHAAINLVKQACTLKIPREDKRYQQILSLYDTSLNTQRPSKLKNIKYVSNSNSSMKVPYWTVDDNLDELINIISNSETASAIQLPFVLENEELLDVFISYKEISVRPQHAPINLISSFSEAKHRLFLSATLADAGDFISELGVEKGAVLNPIKINSLNDTGQKWILDFSRVIPTVNTDKIREYVRTISTTYKKNVLVLTTSNYYAGFWEEKGAKLYSAGDLPKLKRDLKNKNPMIAVLANKYDGIDLPGDLCHITVIDQTPRQSSTADKANIQRLPNSDSLNAPIVRDIEQGMGRAVRSKADYSLVFVLGQNLSNFIYSHDALLSTETSAQWEFSKNITDKIKFNYSNKKSRLEQFQSIITGVLNQEEKWTSLYKTEISKIYNKLASDSSTQHYTFNVALNNAWLAAQQGRYSFAVNELQEKISSFNKSDQAILYECMARYEYKVNKQHSSDLQIKAHELETHLFKPLNVLYEKHTLPKKEQATASLNYLKSRNLKDSNELASYIESINSNLKYSSFSSEEDFREAIQDLGSLLGCNSSQPEAEAIIKDGSPDNLWLSDTNSFVIEDKNQVTTSKISRGDIQQITGSFSWFEKTYSINYVPVLFHRSNIMNTDANTNLEIYVVNEKKLKTLNYSLHKLAQIIGQKPLNEWNSSTLMQAFKDSDLLINDFRQNYCVKATKA